MLSDGMLDIRVRDFDWCAEYGPYWHPGSTAFWLAPTSDEFAEFLKIRPRWRFMPEKPGMYPARSIANGRFPNTSMAGWSDAEVHVFMGSAR